jgi:hypothetical protein
MRNSVALVVLAVAGVLLQPTGRVAAQNAPTGRVDAAFKQFWDARNPQEAAKAAEGVEKSGVSFDDALARLKRGRTYSSQVPRGVVRLNHRTAAGDFWYTLDVPETYDPARAYQVRVHLHGGVMLRDEGGPRGSGSIGALAGAEQIYVIPSGWKDAPWWSDAQIESLRVILDSVKRTYNVDENRVALAGVSDGGTGAYYFAMRDTTPFASFLPLNGFIMVLRSELLEIRGELFPNNLLNKPFFVVNGGLDRLYPAAAVEPFVQHLQRGGVDLVYRPQPGAGHNTAWWPEVKDSFETFVREHPRDPLPARLTWETDQTALRNRAHWLVIDTLGTPRDAPPLADLNRFVAGPLTNFGIRASGTRITLLVEGSNADRFGLLAGDVVVRVNDRMVPSGSDLLEWLSTYKPGTPLEILVSRDNEPVELSGVVEPGATTPSTLPLFEHTRPSGRVDVVREGNAVRATTRGVAAFTLLLSPGAFDFGRPIKVVADGRTVFDGRVKPSVATLMKWAARDNDRTLLVGAEIHVTLAP